MAETTTILKTDVLGRVKIGRDHREALLDAFEQGGASGKAFARDHGVNYQTFASWIQKRRRERGLYPAMKRLPSAPMKLTLAEVEVPSTTPSPAAGSPIEIALPGGLVIRAGEGASLSSVVELVKALRSC